MRTLFDPMTIFIRVVIILTLLPIHECAHAYIANKLGDPTAKNMGRLTLNPMAHMDIIGAVMLVFTGFGFARPVPVEPRNFINPKRGMGVVAAAGPISNIIVSFILLVLVKLLDLLGHNTFLGDFGFYYFIIQFLFMMCYINLSLAVFNLLPVPPLDGSKIIGIFLSDKVYYKFMAYERYLSIALLILVASGVLNMPLSWLTDKLYSLIDLLTFFIPSRI